MDREHAHVPDNPLKMACVHGNHNIQHIGKETKEGKRRENEHKNWQPCRRYGGRIVELSDVKDTTRKPTGLNNMSS